MHEAYKAEGEAMGLPDAPTKGANRPDRKLADGSFAELKPDTESGRKRGWKQAQRYADELGEPCRLDVYDTNSPTLSYKSIGTAYPSAK